MSQEGRINEVFISYSRKNEDYVERIIAKLREKGVDPWFDKEDIPKGAEWWREIQKGIEGSYAFVFIVSPASLSSQVCNWELAHAIENNKKIVPVMHVNILDDKNFLDNVFKMMWSGPSGTRIVAQKNWDVLQGLNFIFLQTTDDLESGVDELLKTARTDLSYIELHTRFLQRAHEWLEKDRNTSYLLTGAGIAEAQAWLARSTTQEISPTLIHVEYIAASRAFANQRRRRLIQIAGASIVLISILVVFGILQTSAAQRSRNERSTQQAIALTESASRSTQQAIALTESASRSTQQAIADRETNIKHSLQLADNAVNLLEDGELDLALALALEANRIDDPPKEAQNALVRTAFAPGARVQFSTSSQVNAVAISPDGDYVIAGTGYYTPVDHGDRGATGRLLMWNLNTGELVHDFEIPYDKTSYGDDLIPSNDQFYGVAFSPDGQLVKTCSADFSIMLWDTISGTFLDYEYEMDGMGALSNEENPRCTVSFSAQDDIEPLEIPEFIASDPYSFAYDPEQRTILTGSVDGDLSLWDLEAEKLIRNYSGHNDSINSIAFSPNGQIFATGSGSMRHYDKAVRVWSTLPGAKMYQRAGTPITSVAFSPDERSFITASSDGATMWDTASGSVIRRLEPADPNYVDVLAYSPNGEEVITVGGNILSLWDTNSGAIIYRIELEEIAEDEFALDVEFSPDSRFALVGFPSILGYGRGFSLIDTSSGDQIYDFNGAPGANSVAFSPDGRLAAVGTGYLGHTWRLVQIWDLETKEIIHEIYEHEDWVTSVAFSPDGKAVMSGAGGGAGQDTNLRLWDVRTGNELKQFIGHNNTVLEIVFSSDGKLALSADVDGVVIIWDVEQGTEIRRRELDIESVKSIAFSPDLRFAITGAEYGSIILWRIPYSLSELIEWTCTNRYVPELTAEERASFQIEDSVSICNDR